MKNDYKDAQTVLLVDDDEDLLHLMELKLKTEGYHTIISLNGERIWEIIAQSRPDLILLDIHMRGIDGGDICRDIKNDPLTSSIPVILFSANENIKTIKEECGADAYMTKPLENNVLLDTIKKYIPHPTTEY